MDAKQVVTNYHDAWTRGDMGEAFLMETLPFYVSLTVIVF
jgi:hypothetical protein